MMRIGLRKKAAAPAFRLMALLLVLCLLPMASLAEKISYSDCPLRRNRDRTSFL